MEAVKATKIGEFYPVSWMDFQMVAKYDISSITLFRYLFQSQ